MSDLLTVEWNGPYDSVLMCRVTHQDKSLLGRTRIATSGEFSISSITGPQLGTDELYINGKDRSADGEWTCHQYVTWREAIRAMGKFQFLIATINNSHKEGVDKIQQGIGSVSNAQQDLADTINAFVTKGDSVHLKPPYSQVRGFYSVVGNRVRCQHLPHHDDMFDLTDVDWEATLRHHSPWARSEAT